PYKSLAELIADAKANPNKLSFGTSGPATSPVIALTQLNHAADTKIVDVPYRGSGEAANAVATGAMQGTFTFFTSAKPLVDAGKAPRGRRKGGGARDRGKRPHGRGAGRSDHEGIGLRQLQPQRLRRSGGPAEIITADRRSAQQGAQRSDPLRRLQGADGGARH